MDNRTRKQKTINKMVLFFRPLFLAIGFLFNVVYTVLIGWWADPLSAKRSDEKLAEDIRNSMTFLFDDHRAVFVKNETPIKRVFDLAVVTMEVKEFRMEFTSIRGESYVSLASYRDPKKFQEVTALLDGLDWDQGIKRKGPQPYPYSNWMEASDILRQNWQRLAKAMS